MAEKETPVQESPKALDPPTDLNVPSTSTDAAATGDGAPVTTPAEKAASWVSGWFQTAKDATWSTLDMVKKDLTEFGDVVTDEATAISAKVSTAVTSNAPTAAAAGTKLWSGLTEGVNKLLLLEDTTEGEEDSTVPVFACDQGKLYAIQADQATYTTDPEGAHELYDDWLDHFSLEERRQEISYLLANVAEVRNFYRKLVPKEVPDAQFWQRYFYRAHVFRLDEERAKLTVESETKQEASPRLSWGDAAFEEDFEQCPPSPAHSDYTVPPNDFVDISQEEIEQADKAEDSTSKEAKDGARTQN